MLERMQMIDYRLSAKRSLLIMAFTSSGVTGCENILGLVLNLKVISHLVFQIFMSATFSQTCICNRVFTDIGAFSQHEKGCKRGKKPLSSALDRAKEVYQRKRTRMSCRGDQPWTENGEMGPVIEGDLLQINSEGSLVKCHEILVHSAAMPYLPLLF